MRRTHAPRGTTRQYLFLAPGGLVILFGLLSPFVRAQVGPPSPPASPVAKSPAEPSRTDIVTIGSSVEKVSAGLGPHGVGSEIPCLGRRMLTFQDGTKVVFVQNRAISAIPGGLAVGSPSEGYVVERGNRRVFIDPALLCGNVAPPPIAECKHQIEESFLYAPRVSGHLVPLPAPLPPQPDFVPLRRIRLF